ncbi:MAG: adenylate/guanylate cyclase domain-containing protein [Thermoflexaceae bacterium]|nr:adenylate/guanylate cyclase domain-containing protein [Thermoflexaceae bacterium]
MCALAPAAETVTGATMFTDIVGFTEYTALRGDDEALRLLALEEGIVREELPAGARVVKELGDGQLLWFADACDAVATGVRLQRRFEEVSEGLDAPLWVRIGVHYGRQTVRRGDVLGHDVNVASRVLGIAGPGEVVVSEATVAAVGPRLPAVCFEEIGPVFMKGLPEAVRLFRASD